MNDRLRLNLKAFRPKSFGFFLLKGLGCRSIGCQSSLTTSKPSSNWIDSPIIRFLPHYTPSIGRPILTGEMGIQSMVTSVSRPYLAGGPFGMAAAEGEYEIA